MKGDTMNYYNEVNTLIENLEISKKVREYKDNSDTLKTYWNIGKLLSEASEKENTYGSNFIREWGEKLSNKYGKNYNSRNLNYYKKFYILFPIVNALRSNLNWTHIKLILPIKNESERNYYLNLLLINYLLNIAIDCGKFCIFARLN